MRHETDESQPRLSITVTNRQVTNPVIMSYHAQAAVVRDNQELLGANAGRSTRHLEVALPSGVAYKAGDHLGVLPRNNISIIAVSCCTSGWTPVSISRSSRTAAITLICPPTSQPRCSASWAGGVADPATRSDIEVMARAAIRSSGHRSRAFGTDDESQTGSATRC